MHRRLSILALFSLALALPALADTLYLVTVDTSSITGTYGSLDFNFNPGDATSQYATLQIENFSSDGALDATSIYPTGDANGTLPGTVSFDNLMGFNDYFEDFTYGTYITFGVYFSGPAINNPNGTSTGGDVFTFSMFSDPGGTIPVLTTDTTDGTAFTIDVNLDGSTTVNDDSSETTISVSPEPGTFVLFGAGGAFCALLYARRRRC